MSLPHFSNTQRRTVRPLCEDGNARAVRPRHDAAQDERRLGLCGRRSAYHGRRRCSSRRQRRYFFRLLRHLYGGRNLTTMFMRVRERIAQRHFPCCRREPRDLRHGRRRRLPRHDADRFGSIHPQEIDAAERKQQKCADECLPYRQFAQPYAPHFDHKPPTYREGLPQQPLPS